MKDGQGERIMMKSLVIVVNILGHNFDSMGNLGNYLSVFLLDLWYAKCEMVGMKMSTSKF